MIDAYPTLEGSQLRSRPRSAARSSMLCCLCVVLATRTLFAASGTGERGANADALGVDGAGDPSQPPSAETTLQAEPALPVPHTQTEADRLLWDGMDAFARGDYSHAITLFERSNALQPNTAMLFNLARAYARLGDCATARLHLQRYLDAEQEPPPDFYQGTSAFEEDCPTPPAGQLPATLPADLGLVGTASGSTVNDSLTARNTDVTRESSTMHRPLPSGPLGAERTRTAAYDTWGYGLLAASGASAVVAVIYGFKAAETNRELEALASELERDPSRTWDETSEGLVSREASRDTIAVSFGVSALALGAAGLVLLLAPVDGSERSPATEPELGSLRVRGDEQGVWAGYGGTF